MSLTSHLPPPLKPINDQPKYLLPHFPSSNQIALVNSSQQLISTLAPPYGERKKMGWVPRSESDFGDGGAFPEIHVGQFPLGMGKSLNGSSGNALPLKLDAEGNVRYDEIVRQGHSKDRKIHSSIEDMLPRHMDEVDLSLPSEEERKECTEKTRNALQMLIGKKIEASAPVRKADKAAPAQYIRHTPAQNGFQFNSGAKQRIIRMVEAQMDPMEPPKFKINKKIPRGPPSPPAPVIHSPTRKISQKEQQEWRIPSCISNWKNSAGFTIPIDKRVAADGRGLQQVHINENFSKLAEALQIADRKAREAVDARAQMDRRVAQLEREKKEENMRKIAQQALETAAGITAASHSPTNTAVAERDRLRQDKMFNRRRLRNLANASGETRTRVLAERDISEKIALGIPTGKVAPGPEGLFDQRLFNQSQGMDSGFSGGADDLYNVYDQSWQPDKSLAKSIYRPSKPKHDEDMRGPVQFEQEEDPFNLTHFLTQAKMADKRSEDHSASKRERREY